MERRIALVTGASKGIGKGIALSLLKEGYYVIANSRNENNLKDILSEINELQGGDVSSRIILFPGDFTSSTFRKKIVEFVIKEFQQLHVLVNNVPGFPGDNFPSFNVETTLSAFNNKLITYIDSMQCFSKLMNDGEHCRIINIVGNNWKYPSQTMFSNSSVNAAIANASKNASFSLGRKGITINCIHPGFIETDRFHSFVDHVSSEKSIEVMNVINEIKHSIPISRIGRVDDIAALTVFLCSKSAGYITGQQISVDGGVGDSLF
jgi:NAD(P)-dependent dehydrogenase (short-subunit alcohol dehydrogenase family)